jgi:hypothetical protein
MGSWFLLKSFTCKEAIAAKADADIARMDLLKPVNG